MDVSIMWFRRDLRLSDNEAVSKAVFARSNCLFIYVIDPWFFKQIEIGWLRVKFLFESLAQLDLELRKHKNRLIILEGDSANAVTNLLKTLLLNNYNPHLYFNHDIQVGYGRERDTTIEQYCVANNVALSLTHNYFLLHDESQMDSWWRQYYAYQYDERYDRPEISSFAIELDMLLAPIPQLDSQGLAQALDVQLPAAKQILFVGGESAARQAVYSFLKDRVDGYRWKLSRPYLVQQGATSLLGPHLAFGTISNRTVFQAAIKYQQKLASQQPKKAFDIGTYQDRLRWRDSFTQRLWFHPELMWENRFPEFNKIYNEDKLSSKQQDYFERWKNGQTGFPLLDAAMTQLLQDGFINFRMRAMAATFLTINCGVSWHQGAQHFMNYLVDGDIAINHWQWQMQAGITNPLSPTFRMYSPTKNFKDRDPLAAYVHFWLPESRGKSLETILKDAKPMLDFAETRKTNGKVISDLRKQVRQRLIKEKGTELATAKVAHRTVVRYGQFSASRYQQHIK
jgi:deoxyribodipyrimidine photo-lyase